MYNSKKLTFIFQPHLFSRTKDLEEAQKKKTQLDKNYNEATPPKNRPIPAPIYSPLE